MPITNDRTPALDLPLPHPDNDLQTDVVRLRDALLVLDTLVSGKASPADIQAAIGALVAAAPGTLDTLNELAAALGADPNFAATVAAQIATKANSSDMTTALAGKLNVWTYSTTAVSKALAAREHCSVTAPGQTITLPSVTQAGPVVAISVGAFDDTVVARNGATIGGISDDVTINLQNVTVHFEYDGTTWRAF